MPSGSPELEESHSVLTYGGKHLFFTHVCIFSLKLAVTISESNLVNT
jgi:hypothetical protein